MPYRLRHPDTGAEFSVSSRRRRDRMLRRGMLPAGEPTGLQPESVQTFRSLSELPWQELRKLATSLGINAKQKRPALERAIAAAKR